MPDLCDYPPNSPKGTLCSVCKRPLPIDAIGEVRRVCRTASPPTGKNAPSVVEAGLGNWAEKALSSIGITKDRFAEVKQAFGLPPTCGCSERQAWLNRVGKRFGIGR